MVSSRKRLLTADGSTGVIGEIRRLRAGFPYVSGPTNRLREVLVLKVGRQSLFIDAPLDFRNLNVDLTLAPYLDRNLSCVR